MKKSGKIQTVSAITYKVESISKVHIEEQLGFEALQGVITNFDSNGIEEYYFFMTALKREEYQSKTKKFECKMKHRESQPVGPSIVQELKFDPKAPPQHLIFFLGKVNTTVIIALDKWAKVEVLVAVLKRFRFRSK